MDMSEKINFKKLSFLKTITSLEDEGWGTAYEYLAKFYILEKIFKDNKFNKTLILGLPQKYGYSMDFVLYSIYKGAKKIYILESRNWKIKNFKNIVSKIEALLNLSLKKYLQILEVSSLMQVDSIIKENVNITFSCEVFQKDKSLAKALFKKASNISRYQATFVPNALNKSHKKISGLDTFYLGELTSFALNIQNIKILEKGYIDAPPVPAGITFRKESRSKKTYIDYLLSFLLNGWFFMVELKILKFLKYLHKKQSHIVYLITENENIGNR